MVGVPIYMFVVRKTKKIINPLEGVRLMNYLVESLKEITKETRNDYGQYPACPLCDQAMVCTFSFPGNESACLPCDTLAPMFNSLEKVWRQDRTMAKKKKLWSEDLSVIGRRIGGATCAMCEDGKCKYCKNASNKNYQFKFWKKNL